MSNYRAVAVHPKTKKIEIADFLDNYFGHHKYGVRFVNEDKVYKIENIEVPPDKEIEKKSTI